MAASVWTTGRPGRPAPEPSPALLRVALQAGATAVAHVDVAAMLSGICIALVPAAGVAGAVLVLREPADPRDPERRRVFGSDTAATRLGELQRRTEAGPGPAADRDGRVLLTPDLTRSGPPELATAAADCGLARALSVPVQVAGQSVGVLQVLARGGPNDRIGEELEIGLRPVVTALAARLSDVRELARLEGAVERARQGSPSGSGTAPGPDPSPAPGGSRSSAAPGSGSFFAPPPDRRSAPRNAGSGGGAWERGSARDGAARSSGSIRDAGMPRQDPAYPDPNATIPAARPHSGPQRRDPRSPEPGPQTRGPDPWTPLEQDPGPDHREHPAPPPRIPAQRRSRHRLGD